MIQQECHVGRVQIFIDTEICDAAYDKEDYYVKEAANFSDNPNIYMMIASILNVGIDLKPRKLDNITVYMVDTDHETVYFIGSKEEILKLIADLPNKETTP